LQRFLVVFNQQPVEKQFWEYLCAIGCGKRREIVGISAPACAGGAIYQ
jgi:hypothetical protein